MIAFYSCKLNIYLATDSFHSPLTLSMALEFKILIVCETSNYINADEMFSQLNEWQSFTQTPVSKYLEVFYISEAKQFNLVIHVIDTNSFSTCCVLIFYYIINIELFKADLTNHTVLSIYWTMYTISSLLPT